MFILLSFTHIMVSKCVIMIIVDKRILLRKPRFHCVVYKFVLVDLCT